VSEIIDALDHEWATYDRRRDVRAFMARIPPDSPIASPTAAALVASVRSTGFVDPDGADLMLAELIRLVPASPIAQRIVVQALLPGVCNIVKRLAETEKGVAVDVQAAEIVSRVGVRVASYSLERRPRFIAMNVLRDVERDYRTCRKREAADELRFSYRLSNLRHEDPAALDALELAEFRADIGPAIERARRARVVPERDLVLVVETRFAERDTSELALEQRRTPDTIRRARHRAEGRLASFYSRERAA